MFASHRHRLSRSAIAVGAALALLLAACSSSKSSSTASTPGTGATGKQAALIIARGMDINSLDPSRSYCDTCQIFMTAVYETLIGLDKDNKTLVPRLAASWSGNSAQTEFTFKLDPKAKFADGSPVTSTDVKFSWERLKALKGASSYLVGSIDTIDATDPTTVKVTLSAANSAFLAQVNASYLGIMNSKVAQANGATLDPATDKAETWFLSNSAGSGPFTLEAYTAGSELRFKRNDNYWGPNPAKFPEVIMKETQQAVTQRQQLEQGAVDISMQISADVAKGMSGKDITVTKVPSFNFVYLALSPGVKGGEGLTPPVREAIRKALDYKRLVDVTVSGDGRPQASPIPNGFVGTEGLAPPQQDIAGAKNLLADAGVTSLSLDATFPSLNVYGVDFSTAMQEVQTELKAVGITLQLNPIEISVWADKITKDGIPVTMLYFAPDHTDSSQYVQYFGLLPDSQWQTWTKAAAVPAETDLLNQAFATQDAAKRADLYKQLANAMINDQIIIPIVNPDLFLASRSNINGMRYSACCNLDLSQLSRS
ncbi:MAG: ABC transporter substrate-binding protein [Ilumatobacteraceae bacterium]